MIESLNQSYIDVVVQKVWAGRYVGRLANLGIEISIRLQSDL